MVQKIKKEKLEVVNPLADKDIEFLELKATMLNERGVRMELQSRVLMGEYNKSQEELKEVQEELNRRKEKEVE